MAIRSEWDSRGTGADIVEHAFQIFDFSQEIQIDGFAAGVYGSADILDVPKILVLVEHAIHLKGRIGIDGIGDLIIGNLEAEPACLLAYEPLAYQALQGLLLELKHLDEILIPVVLVLSLQG